MTEEIKTEDQQNKELYVVTYGYKAMGTLNVPATDADAANEHVKKLGAQVGITDVEILQTTPIKEVPSMVELQAMYKAVQEDNAAKYEAEMASINAESSDEKVVN